LPAKRGRRAKGLIATPGGLILVTNCMMHIEFDLMIKGKGLNELKKYRLELISRGITAGEIPDERFLDIIFFA
jgi:hypothetical protein